MVGEVREVMEADCGRLATVRTQAFPLSETEAWKGSEQGRDSGVHRLLLHIYGSLLSCLWSPRVRNSAQPVTSHPDPCCQRSISVRSFCFGGRQKTSV